MQKLWRWDAFCFGNPKFSMGLKSPKFLYCERAWFCSWCFFSAFVVCVRQGEYLARYFQHLHLREMHAPQMYNFYNLHSRGQSSVPNLCQAASPWDRHFVGHVPNAEGGRPYGRALNATDVLILNPLCEDLLRQTVCLLEIAGDWLR